MTKTNIVLAAAAVVFAAGCFVLFKDNSAQRDRVRALEAQVAQLHRETTADTTASQSVAAETAAPTSEPSAQAAAPPPAQSSAPAVAKPATDANREWRAVLADPAYRRARLAEARLELQRGYPQLVAELGLSVEEGERFLDLLADQSLRENERAMKADSESGQEQARRSRELYAQAEKERRALLGEERFRTWVDYVKSTQARAIVKDLRTQLATTSSPLREEQYKPFVKALATEHERHATERQQLQRRDRRRSMRCISIRRSSGSSTSCSTDGASRRASSWNHFERSWKPPQERDPDRGRQAADQSDGSS